MSIDVQNVINIKKIYKVIKKKIKYFRVKF